MRVGADGLGGGSCAAEWTGDYYGRGHRVSGRWKPGAGESDHHLAAVFNGERNSDRRGDEERGAGNERGAERGAGAECRGESSGRVLHRGVSAGTRANQNRILDSTDDVAGESGGGTNDAGIGDGGTAGFDAVREFRTGDKGE